ncbi:MAG: glutathione synthetase [Firmicutes bacterium]|nr:glutathione synthetase [Bacillota bacterium]
MWDVASIIAAVLTTVSFVPQALKAVQGNTKSVSLWMFIIFAIGVVCWSIYAISNGLIALAFSNSIATVLAGIILTFKIKNIRKGIDV